MLCARQSALSLPNWKMMQVAVRVAHLLLVHTGCSTCKGQPQVLKGTLPRYDVWQRNQRREPHEPACSFSDRRYQTRSRFALSRETWPA